MGRYPVVRNFNKFRGGREVMETECHVCNRIIKSRMSKLVFYEMFERHLRKHKLLKKKSKDVTTKQDPMSEGKYY